MSDRYRPHAATVASKGSAQRQTPGKTLAPHPATLFRRGTVAATATRFPQRARRKRPTFFLIEDSERPGDGQVRRSAFLEALRSRVTAEANRVLAPIGQSAASCPYIRYWFLYYQRKSAWHIEQAVDRYVRDANNANTWREYLECIVSRVKLGLEANVKDGSLAGVPPGVPRDLEQPATVQRKVGRRAIQRCRGGADDSQEERNSRALDLRLRAEQERLDRWRMVVPLTTEREILFRKLSDVRDAFNVNGDVGPKRIVRLNYEANEATDGISLSRNPEFVADVIATGANKVVYACALPARGGYDLEAAYLYHVQQSTGRLPDDYLNHRQNKLSKEVTAETVPVASVIGWIHHTQDGLTYHHNQDLDTSIDYRNLGTYARFLDWLRIARDHSCNFDALPAAVQADL